MKMMSDNASIKSLIQLKEENAKLQEMVNFLQMENFDLTLNCNSIENILSNIKTATQTNSTLLTDASGNVCQILQACCNRERVFSTGLATSQAHSPLKGVANTSNSPRSSKAHKIKPHMVNGTILYIPTINLTRVSDSHTKSRVNSTLHLEGDDSSEERSSLSNESQGNGIGMVENASTQNFDPNSQIAHLEEVSEASASNSPSHSTVLSGTFQEVKIFLNPISQESHNEESRKADNVRRRSKQNRFSGPKYR